MTASDAVAEITLGDSVPFAPSPPAFADALETLAGRLSIQLFHGSLSKTGSPASELESRRVCATELIGVAIARPSADVQPLPGESGDGLSSHGGDRPLFISCVGVRDAVEEDDDVEEEEDDVMPSGAHAVHCYQTRGME